MSKTRLEMLKKVLDFIEFTVSKPKWIIYFFLVIVYVLFHKPIESVISKHVVIAYLNDLEYSFFLDFAFFCVLIFLFLTTVNKVVRNYRINPNKIIVTCILTLIYVYYRNFNVVWSFMQLRTFNIYYFDIIFFILFFDIILIVVNVFFRLDSVIENNETPLILDLPIQEESTDSLNRNKDALKIADRLNKTINEKAIAIGIHGEWGLGKSSFFSLLKGQLRKNVNNEIIDFNPWRGYKDDALSQDFFEALSKAIGRHSDLLEAKVKKYGDTLLGVDNGILRSALNVGTNIFQTNSVESQHQEINIALKKIRKNFYIFIDDLDRLTNDEIVEVVKLIRNTADFFNLKFILAYDRNYLVNALKNINAYNYEKYLEKIILYEYSLPPIDFDRINEELFSLIKKYCKDETKEEVNRVYNVP